jgi:hypothetical protein
MALGELADYGRFRHAINGDRAHHEFQDGTRAQIIGWLYGDKGR